MTAPGVDRNLAPLVEMLGGRVSVSEADLDAHGRDETYPHPRRPAAVVYAKSVQDVVATLGFAASNGLSVIPFGAGTSGEGHLIPTDDRTVSLDLSRMDRIIEIRPSDLVAVVEPGVTRNALNAKARDHGLFFPVDPGADASLGGMAATNASGTSNMAYGGMRTNVAALQVVLVNGDVLQLGRPVRKSSSGYDLRDLFIGSAGTLGVITEVTVRLHPVPEAVAALRASFADVVHAAAAAFTLAATLPVARLELIDGMAARVLNRHLDIGLPETPALWVELNCSSSASLELEREQAVTLLGELGAEAISVATSATDRDELWGARHQLFPATRAMWPGRDFAVGDVAVPLSAVPRMVEAAQANMDRLGLEGTIAGHVGDGNIHVVIPDPEDARVQQFTSLMVTTALDLGGTASGEHGIGLTKRRYLDQEHGHAVSWMREVRRLFDPGGVLNPGKIC